MICLRCVGHRNVEATDGLDGIIDHFALDQPHLRHLESRLQGLKCEIIGQ